MVLEREILWNVYFDNTVANYLISIGIIILGHFLIRIFNKLLLNRITNLVKKLSSSFGAMMGKMVAKKVYPLLYLLLFYIAYKRLRFISPVDKYVDITFIVLTTYYVFLLIQDLAIYSLKKYWEKKEPGEDEQKLIRYTNILIKIFVWIIAMLFMFDNLNIQITGLITGLGIGGIAIAFAAQAILNDVFNYFTILIDQPFDIGDFIVVGENRGTIEHIGVKTTRIRSLSGEQLVISNTDLMNSRINNYKRMEKRRINFSFGVTYQTGLDELKIIPGIIKDIITNQDKTEFERAHFNQFGDYSLIFQVVYYVTDIDYAVYMGIQQEINFRLKEELNKLGVEFAYPTQSLYLHKEE